jgi:hypothetical protein
MQLIDDNRILYRTWYGMISRCHNEKNGSFSYYGAKGVVVCDEWLNNFEQFKSDMGNKLCKDYSIDRINPYGNYEPKNCRWADKKTQANNKRKRELRYNRKRNISPEKIKLIQEHNERLLLQYKYMRELKEKGKEPIININKLARFFNRASKQFNCDINSIRIFRRDIIIVDYLSGKRRITLTALNKCKDWADANGVHFGEVIDYIEVK